MTHYSGKKIKFLNRKGWLLVLSRGGLAVGGLLVIGVAVGMWRLQSFVEKDLAPLVEKNLTTIIDRPLHLGEVEGFSVSGVKFGASAIPPTAADPDRVKADAVEVGFDPLQLLFNRRLKLDVTLVNPVGYVEEDKQGRWITTKIVLPDEPGPIAIDLDRVRLRNGDVKLVPFVANRQAASPVVFSGLNGYANFIDNYQAVRFEVGGQPGRTGSISASGRVDLKSKAGNLQLQAKDLLADEVTPLVKLPVKLQGGKIDGDLQVKLPTEKEKQPLLYGSVRVEALTLRVPQMPRPLANSQGILKFDGTRVGLNDVVTNYGKIPLSGGGTIDFKTGYNLTARVNAASVNDTITTLNIRSPFPVAGVVKSDLTLKGSITRPTLSGTVATVKSGIVDKVQFKSVSSKFDFVTANSTITFKDIRGVAAVGGEVKGNGKIIIGDDNVGRKTQADFNFRTSNAPADSLAQIYNIPTPSFRVGTVAATANLSGTPETIRTLVKFNAPQATYPATGEVVVNRDRSFSFRNVVLAVAGGTAVAYGNWNQQRWQAIADTKGVKVNQLVNKEQLQKINLDNANFNGRVIVSGSSTPFKIAQIRTENANIAIAGGTVAVNSVKFKEQKFDAELVASQVQIGRLLKDTIPFNAPLSGKFQVSGNTENFDTRTLTVQGDASLTAAGGTVTANNIKVRNGIYLARIKANNVQLQQLSPQIPQSFRGGVTGEFDVAGSLDSLQPESIVATGQAKINTAGGIITANQIQVKDGVYLAQVAANNVRVRELSPQVPQSFPGRLTGKFNVGGALDSFAPESLIVSGQANLNTAAGRITATDIQFARGIYRAKVATNNVELQQLSPQIPKSFGGLTGNFNVAGSTKSPEDLTVSGNAFINAGGGKIAASNIVVNNGKYQAKVAANNVDIQQLSPQIPQSFGGLTGNFDVAGSLNSFDNLTASGNAFINAGGGKITASNILVNNGKYQAKVAANNIDIQQLSPQIPQSFGGKLAGNFDVAGSLNSFDNLTASGNAFINAGSGKITASNIVVNNGKYQTAVKVAGVELNKLNQLLKGKFDGNLQLAGNLKNPSLADLRAAGSVQLSQGVPGFEQPLNAVIAWTGNKLKIERAIAPGLNVSGDIFANVKGAGIPQITQLDLNVQASNYNLEQLPVQIPNAVNLAGKVDFNGKITGKLPLPNIVGQLALRDFVINDIAFEPVLAGSIQSQQEQGLQLNVAGKQDQIAVNLNANNRPEAFLVKRGETFASGQSQGDILALNVNQFPLQLLKLPLPVNRYIGSGKIAGEFTGNIRVNQKTFATASGDIAVRNPEIGRLKGDNLTAKFSYSGDQFVINQGQFIKGESSYVVAGSVTQLTKTPQIQGKLNVKQGKIQDVLTALQIYELQDFQRSFAEPTYGKASQLKIAEVGLPNQPLLTQLRRFSEIKRLLSLQKQQRREASPFPELSDLKGTFNAEVNVDTVENKLATQFNIQGENFTWGPEEDPDRYNAKKIIAKGAFEDGTLRLIPLRIESTNRLVSFSGSIGGEQQYGNLQVNNFPLEVLGNFVNLPVGFTGNLTGKAAIAGSIANPLTKGELVINNGTLNQQGIESAAASFNYGNGRLSFASNVIVKSSEPVDISGSIPYKLPFATVAPETNQITLDVNVRNEGLAVLNLFTNQATFEQGEGEVKLTVRGTLQKPIVNGNAAINNATFSAQALPEKLTNVTGRVKFDFDTILVETLQGNFSKGKVVAQGQIPIYNDELVQINNPLSVTLDKLAINLKGLYQGGVGGNVIIKGSALNPVVSGNVNLNNGLVLLPQTDTNLPNISGNGIKTVKAVKQINNDEKKTGKFNNLQLNLGEKVKVERPPIISMQATGNLTVNGIFSNPIPVGTLKLKKGGVNLFTTQFNLARGENNTATFRANQPRDPILDISLFAKVLDVIQSSDFTKSATGLAALETIRVEATVNGPASKLNENLELKSSPARSETEIVALLGGGFDSEGGNSTLGLLNIAGSAVLGNFQTTFSKIGTAFGLSELRIFPTIVSDNPEAGKSSLSVELAAEAGVDITNRISVSALKILTADDPFQWGINYNLKDDIRLRGSTNFSDDNRAVVEYQRRF